MELWQNQETRELLRRYRDQFTRHPIDGNLREKHTKIVEKLFGILKRDGWGKRVEYTGSAYTGLEIGPDREFDVTFILDGSNLTFTKSTKRGEHFYVYPSNMGSKYEDCVSTLGKKRYLDPTKFQEKFADIFFNASSTISNDLGFTFIIRQKFHGAGIQWDIFQNQQSMQPLYSVDLVPSIEEEQVYGREFVAKKTVTTNARSPKQFLWRQSFSSEDKEALWKISKGNKVQKDIVRTLKAVLADRGGRCSLQKMRSYLVYAAVLHENEVHGHLDWSEPSFPDRLRDTLKYWEGCMAAHFMAHPFLPSVNLIGGWKDGTNLMNKNRLRRIMNKDDVFRKIFST